MNVRQVEMQSLLGNINLHNTSKDDDEHEHEHNTKTNGNRNTQNSTDTENNGNSNSNNNVTWPKLKRAHSSPFDFDIHKSPLASLFQPSQQQPSALSRSGSQRSFSFSEGVHKTNASTGILGMGMNMGMNMNMGIANNASTGTFQDVDAQNQFDAFLSTLDRFEDEFDQQAYVDLIPLNIRMALENQIFGWNHLYSAALGHILMPLAAYLLTNWCISFIGLRGVHCQSQPIRYMWFLCTLHKVYHFEEHEPDYDVRFGMNLISFGYLRFILSVWSAISAFRTIRRRRKVWLHHQATEYFRDNTIAHLNMEEADRETLMGRIRSRVNNRKQKYLNRKLMRKIRNATGRFERRERRRRREFHDGAAEYEGDHHRRVQMLSQQSQSHASSSRNATPSASVSASASAQKRSNDNGSGIDIGNGSGSGALTSKQSLDEDDSIHSSPSQDSSASDGTDADEFFDTYQKYKRTAKDEHERDHSESFSEKHFYGHTMPAFAMQSIAQDQIKFQNGPIHNVAYAHGGFFGAAPFMLANPHWIHILRQLMPDVYVEISRRVVNTPVPQLIHWAENNPVVAAYGTAHELEYFGKVPTLEWDVFLDPHLVERVEVVLEARESFLQGIGEKSKRIRNALRQKRVERQYTSKMVNISAMLESDDEKKILHFYNTEIDKRVMLLVEHMLIAHGNVTQLALEQTGYFKHFNFSRVKHTRRTLGGGIYAKHWIMTYAEALKMSTEFDEDISNDEGVHINVSRSFDSPSPSSSMRNDDRDDIDISEVQDRSSTSSNNNLRRRSKSALSEESNPTTHSSGMSPSRLSPRKEGTMRTSTSFQDLGLAAVSTSSIAESMNTLKKIMNCDAPLGLILDIKSRHVPKRVWALLLDSLRAMGTRVEGVGTFFQEDIRDITRYCSAPIKEMMFFHSAGDLQKACHDGIVRRGDTVFFNAGSLLWNYPILKDREFLKRMLKNVFTPRFDAKEYKKQYKFQPYARVTVTTSKKKTNGEYREEQFAETDALVRPLLIQQHQDSEVNYYEGTSSTIQQYKEHFDLSIGLYVQEFAIDETNMELLVEYVNLYSEVYDMGFSWGGVNGVTVRGIQPGRLTNTDGFWNQRYAGERWEESLHPGRLT